MLTKQDIFDLVEEEDVRFIRLQFTDMLGTMRNLAITTSRLEDALDNLCMFDGSSIMGFVGVEESDLYLHPDFDTFEIFPWRPHQGKVARLICDVYKPDGTRLESDPRYILQTVIKEAEEMGYKFNVGPECEFFLFNTDERGNPTTEPHDNAGYFDLTAKTAAVKYVLRLKIWDIKSRRHITKWHRVSTRLHSDMTTH